MGDDQQMGQQLPMEPIYTDRSRIEAYQKCPRYRFWQYEYLGEGETGVKGIVPAREIPPAWALLTGIAVHRGLELILRGETAAAAALKVSLEYLGDMGHLLGTIEDPEVKDRLLADAQEQADLTLALVYGWSKVQLPKYREMYEPCLDGIEREERMEFTIASGGNGDGNRITLLTRTDLLSIIKGTDNHVIHNFKTVSVADQKWRQGFRYDQQTLTEYMAVEGRIGKQVTGVIIEGLVKGKRAEYPEGSGIWRHGSPLVNVWYREGSGGITPPEFYARYAWTCKEPHEMAGSGNRKGKLCPGGVGHRLSGVYKQQVSKVYPGGIISWIDYLAEHDRDLLEQQFISLEPICRSEYEITRWQRQVLPLEREISTRAMYMQHNPRVEVLDALFPMYTGHGNCLWPSPCGYVDICWGSADPQDRERFKPRVPNHPAERG